MNTNKFLHVILPLILTAVIFTGCGKESGGSSRGYEEGTSVSDGIVNTSAAEKVILVVSFGTSFNEARDKAIGGIENALKTAYSDYQVRRAFTSQIIIDKLSERDGLTVDNIKEAMDRLVSDGVKEAVIQPTHVMPGYEYDDIISEIAEYSGKFESLKIGKPLLSDDSDYDEIAELLVKETSPLMSDGTAAVFVGHGTDHTANSAYAKFQEVLKNKGYDSYLIGTVGAEPDIEDVQKKIKELGAKKVILCPFMVTAGDHANNDMAGDEEGSWKTVLESDGYEVETVFEGLGQIKEIQDIYVKHVRNAVELGDFDSNSGASKPENISGGISANRIKDGTYNIDASSSSSMFKIVDCRLSVLGDKMTADITLSGQGFEKVYMGTGEEALADSEGALLFSDNGGKHSFTVPVGFLDGEIDCAGLSAKKQEWYDHTVVFQSDGIPDEAFEDCEINVSMTGGTGKSSINSPAKLIRKNGEDFAEIVWSSSNYIYMIFDGNKYNPVNSEGNSVFEIPVILDKDMKITACTVAMSQPKEIEYSFHFESESVRTVS